MGDRGVIVVKDGDRSGAGIYTHWGGSKLLDSLKAAIPTMRKGDSGYSAARLCASMCNEHPGNKGIGLLPPPQGASHSQDAYTQGDAGVLVYDCYTGETTAFGGYLSDNEEWPLILDVPPE